MITGYNHNIMHKGRVYHIQTEDSGVRYAHIITHLFVGGNIIGSTKSSYSSLLEKELEEEALETEIRGLMKEQHKQMLKSLKKGNYDHVGERKEAGGELLTPGLIEREEEVDAGLESAENPVSSPSLDDLAAALGMEEISTPPPPTDTSKPSGEYQVFSVEISRDTNPELLAFVDEEGASETPSFDNLETFAQEQNVKSSTTASPLSGIGKSRGEGKSRFSLRRDAGRERPSLQMPRPPKPRKRPTRLKHGRNSQTGQQGLDSLDSTAEELPIATKQPLEAGDNVRAGQASFSERRQRPMLELRKPERKRKPPSPRAPGLLPEAEAALRSFFQNTSETPLPKDAFGRSGVHSVAEGRLEPEWPEKDEGPKDGSKLPGLGMVVRNYLKSDKSS